MEDINGKEFDYKFSTGRVVRAFVEAYDPDIGLTAVRYEDDEKRIAFCFYGKSSPKYVPQTDNDKAVDDQSIPVAIDGIRAGLVVAEELVQIRNDIYGNDEWGGSPDESSCAFA